MAKNNEEISKAEIYRQERNKRLNESTKKNAKRKAKHPKLSKMIKSIVAIVIAVAILGGGTYGLVVKYSGIPERLQTVVKIGDEKISMAEFQIAYMQRYNYHANMASQYQQAGYDYGFSTSKSPAEQTSFYKDEEGVAKKWDQVLKDETIQSLNELFVLYKLAIEKGYTLNKEEIEKIDKGIEELRASAVKQNLGVNPFLVANFGAGINKKVYKDYLEVTSIVTRFQEDKQKELADQYNDDVLLAEYKTKTDDFDVVDLRVFKFEIEALEKKSGESDEDLKKRQDAEAVKVKGLADDMFAKCKDESTFLKAADEANKAITDAAKKDEKETATVAYDADTATESYRTSYSSLKSTISEDASKWAFADDRKALDKSVFKTDTACFVVVLTAPQFALNTISVRHILVPFGDGQSSQNPTAKEVATAKESADKIYKEWKDGAATEDSFAELAKTNSTDTGSKDKGGLYEKVNAGDMVPAFDNWCFDKARKAGDTGVVKTDYGFHIMYFVSNNTDAPNWKSSIKQTHTEEDYTKFLEEQIGLDTNKLVKNDKNAQKSTNNILKTIDLIIKSNAASQQQQQQGAGAQVPQ